MISVVESSRKSWQKDLELTLISQDYIFKLNAEVFFQQSVWF